MVATVPAPRELEVKLESQVRRRSWAPGPYQCHCRPLDRDESVDWIPANFRSQWETASYSQAESKCVITSRFGLHTRNIGIIESQSFLSGVPIIIAPSKNKTLMGLTYSQSLMSISLELEPRD